MNGANASYDGHDAVASGINAGSAIVVSPTCTWPFVAERVAVERRARILIALDQRGYAPGLADRIENLLDGREDRTRLRCCSSGCFVCMQELLKIVAEVEAADGVDKAPPPVVDGCVKVQTGPPGSTTPV
jgi:hypothetical protein